MKNKIKRFSNGDFSKEQPDVKFSETNLVLLIGEGEVYQGSFTLENKKEEPVRGLVYASSFRIKLKESGFEGNPIEISFSYDANGLEPGYVENGYFTVVCNGGEYRLSFTAIIERPYLMTSHGKVQNMKDFKLLAMKDFMEAQRLFRSMSFYEILHYENPRVVALYNNMRKWSLGEQAVEEFLVGIKQKECLFLSLSEYGKKIECPNEAIRENIMITKNTWGYMPIRVSAEGGFIQISCKEFTTDDFIGNTFGFNYVITPHVLHAGKNYGRIIFTTPYEKIVYEIEADKEGIHSPKYEQTFYMSQIIKGYFSCITGKNDLLSWAEDTTHLAEKMEELGRDPAFCSLLKAHAYLESGQTEQAAEIIENYNYGRFDMTKKPENATYYLYLAALLKNNNNHLNFAEELRRAYMRYPKMWAVLCMLVDVEPEYKNITRRLAVLEKYFYMNKSTQTLLYFQAFKCYREDVTSLKKLGEFEIRVLGFASRYELFTRELALYTANIAGQQKSFDIHLYHLLERIYGEYPEPMILTAICTLLIKGNQISSEYFKWFELAVQQEIKIVQLYEYYMMTIEEWKVREPLPKSVCLYFTHGNTLTYEKTAFLYANIIQFQEETSELYLHYREQMEEFTWEQLLKRHINEPLRILYKKFCVESAMDEEKMEALYDICHAYEVKADLPFMKAVFVIEKDGEIHQRAGVVNGKARIFLYDKDSRVIWESMKGRHYTDSIPYETTRLFYEMRFMDLCKKFEKKNLEPEKVVEIPALSFENIKKYGTEPFTDQDIFELCCKRIREEGYDEDEFLLHICFELFRRGQYDKVILTYLSMYYCGATADMKKIWHAARKQGVKTDKLAERIITQMMFSEHIFGEEQIFADYYEGTTYFRLKRAYFAYISREYLLRERQTKECIFDLMEREVESKEELPEICKIAYLKYYSEHDIKPESEALLKRFLRELCEKQIIFPFYLKYQDSWLREMMLYDKIMIEYRANKGSQVIIEYKIRKTKSEEDTLHYQKEVMPAVYEDIHVKEFILYSDEIFEYHIKEKKADGTTFVSEKKIYQIQKDIPAYGVYGRLDDMSELTKEALHQAMTEYRHEQELAKEFFMLY
nr:DUF5717 family protein [uncultured Sellimonas sp.]